VPPVRVGYLALCLSMTTALLATPPLPRDAVARGVRVAGVAVGGMTAEQARAALGASAPGVVALGDERTWVISAEALGVELDAARGAGEALAVGRTGGCLQRWAGLISARLAAGGLAGHYGVDEAQARRALRRLAARVDRAPTPAHWSTGGGRRYMVLPVPGRLLQIEQTLRNVCAAAEQGAPGRVAMVVVDVHARASAEVVQGCGELLGEAATALPAGSRGANARVALRAMQGAAISPLGWLSVGETLLPIRPERGWVFGATGDQRVCLGGGAEIAAEVVRRAAQEAGMMVVRETLAGPLAAVTPLAGDLLIGNASAADALVVTEITGDRASVRIMGRHLPVSPAELGPRPEAASDGVTIALVGDVRPDGPVGEPGELGALLRAADLGVANLECPASHRGEPLACKLAPGEWAFRATPEQSRRCLKSWGIEAVSLANNHALDYGPEALADTLRVLHSDGVAAGGAGPDARAAWSPIVVDRGGLRVGVVCCVGADSLPQVAEFAAGAGRPGLAVVRVDDAHLDEACGELARRVRELRWQADVVMVSMHTGREATGTPTKAQRRLAHAAAEAGADLVIGHHPHRLQPVEIAAGCVIAYSLGNFIFPPAREKQAHTGVLVVHWGERGLLGVGVVPAVIEGRTPRVAKDMRLRRAIARELM